MMKAVVLSSVALACNANLESEWNDFKVKFAKTYEDDLEEATRLKVFMHNMEFIAGENRKGHAYTLGVTQFADLTSEEFSNMNWGLLQHNSDEGLPYLGEHTFRDDIELPASVDWSYHGAVTGIKNQGQCGSCWAFSGIGALEGANQISTGRLVSLSEQQMVDCDGFPNRGCSGGQMTTVFGHAKSHGVCTEGSYRYEMRGDTCRESSCSFGISKGMVKGYKKVAVVPGLTSASEKGLMTAVAQQPVSIGIEADKPIFQHYRGGVLDGACGGRVDHGVLAVGYGTTGGVDYWKVKNSWGMSWGSNGYVFLKRGKSLSGECGILSQPSYPVIASSEVTV